jgi:nucleoside-diphosphate-sugar epimerase
MIKLAHAQSSALCRRVYNVTSFSISAQEFRERVLAYFPNAQIEFEPDIKRQGIVDSWPAGLNDDDARRDWGWIPEFDIDKAFRDYLVPNIKKRYE